MFLSNIPFLISFPFPFPLPFPCVAGVRKERLPRRLSQGCSLQSGRVLDQSQQKCRFFAKIQVCCKFFSAPTQKGNLLFLSKRSSRKRLYNFPIKLNHLCRTSRHVWLSSSACDCCCTYQLICIMTISTYTTGARGEMTRLLGSYTVKK